MHYKANPVCTAAIARRLVTVIALAALTFGCSSMKAYTADDYDRAGATSEKYYKDSRACDKQAEAHGTECTTRACARADTRGRPRPNSPEVAVGTQLRPLRRSPRAVADNRGPPPTYFEAFR